MFLQSEDFNVAPSLSWQRRPRDRRLAPRIVIAWRAFRVFLHIIQGLLLAAFILPISSQAKIATHTRRWSQRLLKIMAVRVHVHNILSLLPLPGQVIVLNHISWLDVFVLNSLLPARFVTKADVKQWPLIGFMCQRAGCLFLERQRPRAVEAINTQIRKLIAQGEVIALFPEGTTTRGTALKPFKSALLQAAIDSGTAIVPITLQYHDPQHYFTDAAAYVGEMNLVESILDIVSQKSLQVDLRVLPACASEQYQRVALARQLEQLMFKQLFT